MAMDRREFMKTVALGAAAPVIAPQAAGAAAAEVAAVATPAVLTEYALASRMLTNTSEVLYAVYESSPLLRINMYKKGCDAHRERDEDIYHIIAPKLETAFAEGAKLLEQTQRFQAAAAQPGPVADLLTLEKKRLKSLLKASAEIRAEELKKGPISGYGYLEKIESFSDTQRILNGEFPGVLEDMRTLNSYFESLTEYEKLYPAVRERIKGAYAAVEAGFAKERDAVLNAAKIDLKTWEALFRTKIYDVTGGHDRPEQEELFVNRKFGDMSGWRVLHLCDGDAAERVVERLYFIVDGVRDHLDRFNVDETYKMQDGTELPGIHMRLQKLVARLYAQYPNLHPDTFGLLSRKLRQQIEGNSEYINTYRQLHDAKTAAAEIEPGSGASEAPQLQTHVQGSVDAPKEPLPDAHENARPALEEANAPPRETIPQKSPAPNKEYWVGRGDNVRRPPKGSWEI